MKNITTKLGEDRLEIVGEGRVFTHRYALVGRLHCILNYDEEDGLCGISIPIQLVDVERLEIEIKEEKYAVLVCLRDMSDVESVDCCGFYDTVIFDLINGKVVRIEII